MNILAGGYGINKKSQSSACFHVYSKSLLYNVVLPVAVSL